MDHILAAPASAETSHYLFKRAFPFGPRDRLLTPDLWDIMDSGAFMLTGDEKLQNTDPIRSEPAVSFCS
jgi:hypothetical protein